MMKRLLFSALTALFAFSASAVEVGDYVYTPSGRYQLGALKSEFSFGDDFEGWTSISDEALLDNFQVVDGYVSASSAGAANTKGLYKSFTVDNNDKTYVLVFDAKANESTGPATSFTPKYLGTVADHIAHLNVFATESGEYVNTATGAGTVAKQADLKFGFQLTSEYQTYATALTNEGSDLTWFIEMSQFLDGVSVGNIKVYEATQVYDNRFIQNKIDYLNAIIGVYDWESMEKTAAETKLWEFIKAAPEDLAEMSDATTVEDGETKITAVNDSIAKFFGAFFGDYAADNAIRLEDGGGVSKGTGAVAGWAPNQRWWHTNKAANLYWGNFAYTYGNSNTITQTKNLAAGSYVFAVDAFMDAMGKKGTINGHNYGYYSPETISAICRGELTLSVLNESNEAIFTGKTVALDNQTYLTGVVAFTIPEGQDGNYTFKIFGADSYAEKGITSGTNNLGGNGNMKDLRIYFKAAGKYDAKQLAYIEKVRTQFQAMRDAYDKSVSYYTDPEEKYYWYKWAVSDTAGIYAPYLAFYETLTDDDIINGFDDPLSKEAKAEWTPGEGEDPDAWDYNFSYEKYVAGTQAAADSLTNRAVRPLLRLNERFLGYNQVVFDLYGAIDKANVILDTRVFSGRIAYDGLKNAVGDALAMMEDFKEDPGDEETLVDVYIPAVQTATSDMNTTITNFYESGYNQGSEPTVLRNFDFEDAAAFTLDDPETDPGAGKYTSTEGVMTFNNLELSGITGQYYNNGWYDGTEWTNQGVLRVGNGDGTIALDAEEMVSGSDALHVSFDYYYGSLNGREAGLYLKDDEGNKVSGLMCSKYSGTSSYNPFGVDFNKDFSSVGSSSASNVAIVAESNKTHFDYYLDYGLKTMFVVISNSSKGTVNKRYDLAMDNQNPVASIVVNSNYNNSDRRCWVDNIVIEKIPLPMPSDFYHRELAGLINSANKYVQEIETVPAFADIAAELSAAIAAARKVSEAASSTEDDCKTAAETLKAALDKAKETVGINGVETDNTKLVDGKYLRNGKIVIIKGGKEYNAVGAIIK